MLVNFSCAQPVGHAVEALHYALGHYKAHRSRDVHVALSARTPVELAEWCPFVTRAYAIEHPFTEPGPAPFPDDIPREWDWVLDDGRRYQAFQTRCSPACGTTTPPRLGRHGRRGRRRHVVREQPARA